MIDYCPAVYLISNSKFKVRDKKIIYCKKKKSIIIRTYIQLPWSDKKGNALKRKK